MGTMLTLFSLISFHRIFLSTFQNQTYSRFQIQIIPCFKGINVKLVNLHA